MRKKKKKIDSGREAAIYASVDYRLSLISELGKTRRCISYDERMTYDLV